MSKKSVLSKLKINSKLLIEENYQAVDAYNMSTIPRALWISIIALLMTMLFSIFRESMRATLPAYTVTLVGVTVLFLLFQVKKIKKYPMIFAYSFGLIFYLLVLYLSVIRFETRPAASVLTFFVVVPLIFIDRSLRMNIYVCIMFIVHLVLSYILKGSVIGAMDMLNTSISLILGVLFGRLFLISRLKTFVMEKQLRIEKETDFLTGLLNRRRFNSDFKQLENLKINHVGVMIMDIDNFKAYNDKHGHLSGDNCLVAFGQMLQNLEKTYPVSFYRLGGEEFVGVAQGMEETELLELANHIRVSIKTLNGAKEPVTTSIGLSICKDACYESVDQFLESVDKALYKAKELGRDRVESNF